MAKPSDYLTLPRRSPSPEPSTAHNSRPTMASDSKSYMARVSRRVIFSYALDWLLILYFLSPIPPSPTPTNTISISVLFAIGGALSTLDARHHAFSLTDPSISYPYTPETISTLTLLLVSIVAPALTILLVCLLLVPGPTASRSTPKALIWRRKLWEINTGLLGLGIALAGAFVITEGLKDLYGKPRPDLLSRCDPDLAHIRDHIVGGLSNFLEEAPPIVSWTICRNKSKTVSHDGFAAFPSGHSSFSFAGMAYLTFFLAAKFNAAIPFLSPRAYTRSNSLTALSQNQPDSHSQESESKDHPLRNQAAAPPIPHLILVFLPLAVSAYIASTRWADYRHHGFDVIVGSILGVAMAWLGFRWYHLPIRRGSGWSWGARTRDRAFGVEVGIASYVGDEGWERATLGRSEGRDVETGRGEPAVTSGGLADEGEAHEEVARA